MGGNALSVRSVRLAHDDYFLLWQKMSSCGATLIPAYRNKVSFGDMDIIIPLTKMVGTTPKQLLENCGLTVIEQHKNGKVTSCGVNTEYGVFQIDVIVVPDNEFDFSLKYFSFNDLGNLIGRVSRGLNLKFGHNGLWYTIRSKRTNDTVLGYCRLTLNFDEALEYLDLDHNKFNNGFDDLVDMFEYVMSSKYYDWNRFDLSKRNYAARVRDRKRPTYRAFLKYAKNKPFTKLPNKDTFLSQHIAMWPELKVEIDRVTKIEFDRIELNKKFNGNIVMGLTGLQGKLLGAFMKECIVNIGKQYMLTLPQDQINSKILNEFAKFKV